MEQSENDPRDERSAADDEQPWRFKAPIAYDDIDYVDDEEERVGTAWLQLQLVHTSFRHMETKEYRELSARLEEIERLFMERDSLAGYYRQCFAPEGDTDPSLTGPSEEIFRGMDVRHAVAIQAQFLEDMFFVLELDRHANAPDNRGWMNLFRRWGRSATFNYWFDTLRATLTLGFLEFYDLYLRYHPCRIDEKPVPHPWDAEQRRRDYRDPGGTAPPTGGVPPTDCDASALRTERKVGGLFPGLFLDSGIKEVEDRSPTEPDARSGPGSVTTPGGGGPTQPKGPTSGATEPPLPGSGAGPAESTGDTPR